MGYKVVLKEEDIPLQVAIDNKSPYDGIIFNYKTVAIKDTIFGNCKVKFTYDIIEDPLELISKMSYNEKQEFERHLGDILLEIVSDIVGADANRDDNTPEPVT